MNAPVSLACVGDVMCGDSFYNIGLGCAASIEKYGEGFLDCDIVELFRGQDAVIGNMESPLSDRGKNTFVLRSLHMRGSPRAAPLLSSWGFTVLNVANNHILDHGLEAAVDTVERLWEAGIRVIGGGGPGDGGPFGKGIRVEKVKSGDAEIVFIGVCLAEGKYSYGGGGELPELLDQVKEHSREAPVIVSVHWGDEYIDRPPFRVREIGRKIIEVGASAVIGHHPHVVQGIERYRNGVIAYSLGNFFFDAFEPDCRWSIILILKLGADRRIEWDCVPVIADPEHRPRLPDLETGKNLLSEIERRCRLLEIENDDQYDSDLMSHQKRVKRNLRKHLLRHAIHYPLYLWPQIAFSPVQRKLGLW